MKKYLALIISLAMLLACAPAFTLTAAAGEYKKLLTVADTVVDSKVYDGNTSATVTTAGTLNGVNTEDEVILSATGTFDDKNAGEDKDVTVSYTLSGKDAGKYALAMDERVLKATISKKELTLTGVTVKVVGGVSSIVSQGTLNGIIGTDGVNIDTATPAYIAESKSVLVTYTLKGDGVGNYCVSPMTIKLVASVNDGSTTTEYNTLEKAWSEAQEAGTATVTLLDDAEYNLTNATGKNITLDLNGYVLKAASAGSVITNEGTLTIKDSKPTTKHYFKVNADGLWVLESTEPASVDYTFDAENGLRKDGQATDDIPAENKIIEVSGGCITGGKAPNEGANGGGVLNHNSDVGATFTLESGNIVGNSGHEDGGINNNDTEDKLIMTDGSVMGNSCSIGTGGVYNGGTFVMTGGRITYNTTKEEFGGVYNYFENASLTIGGTAKIYGNKGIADNLAMKAGTKIAVGDSTNSVLAPAEGMNVYVTLFDFDEMKPAAGQFTSNGALTDAQYFHSDNNAYDVKFVKDHLELVVVTVKIDTNTENGKIEVDKQDAATEATVTVTATPNEGYELDEITVEDKDGTPIEVTENHTFVMPSDGDKIPVTVSATFKRKVVCAYWKESALEEGEAKLSINGKDAGVTVTLAKKDNGWTIKKGEKYLAFDETEKKLAESNDAFVWTNSGSTLFAQVKTRTMRRGWFGWWRPSVQTTNYYLTTDDNGLAVSTTRSTVKIGEMTGTKEHDYTYTSIDDTKHKAECSRCDDEFEEAHRYVNNVCQDCGHVKASAITINVNCGVTFEPGFWLFWWSRPTYTAWADVQGENITKVEISADGENYRRGQYFTSYRNVTKFFVRVTDKNGATHVWQYQDGKTSPVITTKLINFTIDGTDYQAEEGMTWAEWVASEYNEGNSYVISDDNIRTTNGTDITKDSSNAESKDNTILDKQSYELLFGY